MSTGEGGSVGARRRGRPARISRHQIVEAALELGLDSFTMHGIAERLGVTTPALYSHVAGRQQVLDLVNETLRRQMLAFSSDADDWRTWLTEFAGLVRQWLSGSVSSVLDDLSGPAASMRLGMGEPGMRLLVDAGLSPREAGYALWLVARVAVTVGPAHRPTLAAYTDAARAVLPPSRDDFPLTNEAHTAILADADRDTFAFDLRVVLDGIQQRIDAGARR